MTTAQAISLAMSVAGGAIGLAMIFRPHWLPGLVKPAPEPTEDELMARALWDATGGEPANDAARELCRRWGEDL
ncbi:hypothetical protein [Delftia acidovorans]|uniref:hypothetical protein n=1 Tax=Delftia acidovorans TaxID=80866 RepID=UPI0012D7CC90|nr:hypothetical protein [Delftia acidovorans]